MIEVVWAVIAAASVTFVAVAARPVLRVHRAHKLLASMQRAAVTLVAAFQEFSAAIEKAGDAMRGLAEKLEGIRSEQEKGSSS